MSDTVWAEPIYVPFLQWLVKGPLRQNLPQAVRLWVWLHILYGPQQQQLALPKTFTYADCRAAFFTASHPGTDAKPGHHDDLCPCEKCTAAWLFSPELGSTQPQWLQGPMPAAPARKQFLAALKQTGELPENIDRLLDAERPFAVTRRTLTSDLKRLHELGWLQQRENGYGRVASWPTYPAPPRASELTFLMQPDLAVIAANLSQEIEGTQRFFVHTDYVVPPDSHDRVEDWQDALRELWMKPPILPIKLSYWSASRLELCEVVVYPVCIYYYRRGPYLCGWGQVPGQIQDIDWRNYRLDRIEALTPLDWQEAVVPAKLKQAYDQKKLPLPENIQLWMAEAWGFDYYQPANQLLVRFDQEWEQRYIGKSLRHETFKRVSYAQAQSLISKTLTPKQQQKLLKVLATRPRQDAYYQAMYRHNDPNVRQRLRAWRPHIEVLLPWSLRQRFAQEVVEEAKCYAD
ncbi:MAG: TIGR03985 family CRISPR-associated protein [Phormidesmis priestleyi]|uniref:TIGR03985 family CRISPR-associated protein n=1 Tax=Phormidesmis priestleyi TaxID=268141 RepID=A0A2W4XAJ0_9CYAN|nr:MAG: TIGR03985 family CRISPR-associated protein [Phormidesmis priestleyi]